MAWQQTPLAVLLFAVTAVTAGLAVFAALNRDVPGGTPLSILLVAAAEWTLSYTLGLLWTGLDGKVLFTQLGYLGTAVVPITWLWFMLEYTGREDWLTLDRTVALSVVPVVTLAFVFFPETNLVWTDLNRQVVGGLVLLDIDNGPLYWVFTAYSYILLAVGTFLLVQMLVLSAETYRGQSTLMLAGILVPWVANVAYVFGFTSGFNPTPPAFAVTSVVFLMAIHRYRLLDVVPVAREVARDEVFEHMNEGVLIVDRDRRVVDANPAAERLVGDTASDLVGAPLPEAFPELAAVLLADGSVQSQVDFTLEHGNSTRYYDVRTAPLRRGYGVITGHLVSIRDVTGRRQREQRLDVLNRALRHDLRNEANVVLTRTELAMQDWPEIDELGTIRTRVLEMVDLSDKVRQLERTLDLDRSDRAEFDLVPVLERAVESAAEEFDGTTFVCDLPESAVVEATGRLDIAIENAVENAAEHNTGADPEVDISIVTDESPDGYLDVRIADNGDGIPASERAILLRGEETPLDHVSGLGLWIINWVVEESGGAVFFDENEPRGSVVTIRLRRGEGSATGETVATGEVGVERPGPRTD